MTLRPLHHVTLSVRSLDRSLHFYRDLLGMRVTLTGTIDDDAHEQYLRLPAGATGDVAVLQLGPPVGAVQLIEWHGVDSTATPPRPGDPGAFLLAFEVTGEALEDVLTRLAAAGVEAWSTPKTTAVADYGTIRAVIVEDPDGTMIELLELPSVEQIAAARRAAQATTAGPSAGEAS